MQRKRTVYMLVASLILTLSVSLADNVTAHARPAHAAGHAERVTACGVERWRVKIGMDPDARLVKQSIVVPTSIGQPGVCVATEHSRNRNARARSTAPAVYPAGRQIPCDRWYLRGTCRGMVSEVGAMHTGKAFVARVARHGATRLMRLPSAPLVKTFVHKFANDWSMNLASMMAYSLITAIFPLLLTILSIVGLVLHAFLDRHIDDLARALTSVFPARLHSVINLPDLLRGLVQITGPLAVVSLLALLWLGSNLFANVENAFSIIFRVRGRDLLRQRIMAIGMVLVLTLLLPISLGAASFITAGSEGFRAVLPTQVGLVPHIVGPLTSLVLLWLLFLLIYIVVPNFTVRFRDAWRGAVAAALLFGIFQILFPLYFKVFLQGNIRYGAAAATVLVVIIWLWIFALITVVGAQINAIAMGLQPMPYDLARTIELVYEDHDLEAHVKRIHTHK